MKVPRAKVNLVLSKACRPPPIKPPPYDDVIQALQINPSKRTQDQIQTIFRYLLLNKKLLTLLEYPERVEEASKSAQLIRLKKGEVLFFEGDDPDGWYMVLQGSADVIIRLFLVAEDCLFEAEEHESIEYAYLMDLMDIDVSVDKLKKATEITAGYIFGQQSYLLERRRSATIVGSSETSDIIKFPPDIFQKTSSLILARNIFNEHKELAKKCFPRLKEEQLILISSLADIIDLPMGKSLTSNSSFGNYLYIVKKGTLARYRVVDFTNLSFRKIDAPFERLELHFPDGFRPVHTDDIEPGSLLQDPSINDLCDQPFNFKATTDVELVAFNLDYFRIIAGSFEVQQIKQELTSSLTDEDVIRIWVNDEKKKLWINFKNREMKESHREIKSNLLFKRSQVVLRVPKIPKSIKSYKYKKIIPYAPKTLL